MKSSDKHLVEKIISQKISKVNTQLKKILMLKKLLIYRHGCDKMISVHLRRELWQIKNRLLKEEKPKWS